MRLVWAVFAGVSLLLGVAVASPTWMAVGFAALIVMAVCD